MYGSRIPSPKKPSKSKEVLARERREKVAWLIRESLLKSGRIRRALLKVRAAGFVLGLYRYYACLEVLSPMPGGSATISCRHSYPLFYEPLGRNRSRGLLDVGPGSGYGTAIARGLVGDKHMRRAVITHSGSELVATVERNLGPQVQAMGCAHSVDARLAHGLVVDPA